jgi:5-methylcytosine-specific restriction endonuclease McrA
MARKNPRVDVKSVVLQKSGYMCANPECRRIFTLDIRHLEPVEEGGPNTLRNLFAFCPNCKMVLSRF